MTTRPPVAPRSDTAPRLLITGSRNASPEMLDYAARVVAYAKSQGWSIIVGDAEGIDAKVIEVCLKVNIEYRVFGITPNPRNGPNGYYTRVSGNFLTRDRTMVQHADRIGVSRQRINQFLLERNYERYCIWRKRKTVEIKAESMEAVN